MEDVRMINENEPQKRPPFLTALCILTFIASGLGSISALVTPLFSDLVIEFLKSGQPKYDEATMNEAIIQLKAGWGYYSIIFILSVCSLTGAILMWQLKKIGFHFYALSNLLSLFVPFLMLHLEMSLPSIMLTGSFVALYALNLKFMK
jgi:hypothetical protein